MIALSSIYHKSCQYQACSRFQALVKSHEWPYNDGMAEDSKKIKEAAAILGRLGGKVGGKIGGPKGGRARARKLSPERRRAIARKAAQARWTKAKRRLQG